MDFICLIKTVNMLILFEDVIDLSVESRIAEYQMRTGFFFFFQVEFTNFLALSLFNHKFLQINFKIIMHCLCDKICTIVDFNAVKMFLIINIQLIHTSKEYKNVKVTCQKKL